jgi:hypothetical protein
MKSMLFVFLSLFLVSNTGCAASFWKGWSMKGSWERNADAWHNSPVGALPASRAGDIQPRKFRSFETWSGYSWYESGEQVFVQEIYLLDGTVKRSFVKYPYEFKGSYTRVVYYYSPTTDDPAGWKVAGVVYGPPRPKFKK